MIIIGDEAKHLKWLVDVVHQVFDHPLWIDGPNPEVIKSLLPLLKKHL